MMSSNSDLSYGRSACAPHRSTGKAESVRRRRSLSTATALLITLLAASLFSGCQRSSSRVGSAANSQTAGNAGSASPSPRKAQPQTEFERDLDYVRTGSFRYIYVISRPDGSPLNDEDITYLTQNTPKETNQRVSSEGRRRIIVGTNFVFTPENLDALRKRFTVEDYSGK